MHNLLLLFARVGNLILFAALEILCIYLIVNYNQTQKGIYINSTSIFSASLNKRMNSFTEYSQLGDKNDRLADENSKLLEDLINLRTANELAPNYIDSTFKYRLISAAIINNSVRQKNNKLTLNKGRKDGIKKGMGVINNEGIIGIISDVSENFASAMSILNLQTNISVRLKKTNEIGELKWDGQSVKKMIMSSVPPHAVVSPGDSIITSGFSTVFPPNIYIGNAGKVSNDIRSGFLSIEVFLNNDISSIDYVYVIENIFAAEQLELESNGQ